MFGVRDAQCRPGFLTGPMQPVRTYAEFSGHWSARRWARTAARDIMVWLLSFGRNSSRNGNEIRFPYYHHVFDDERAGFARQLRWMRNYGDFISFEDAVSVLASGDIIDGRYFSISFDDGFKNCVDNALPLLREVDAPAAFFLPTRYIGTDVGRDRDLLLSFYDDRNVLVEFMNWDDCRRLADAGMTIGSHTHSHALISSLAADDVIGEMIRSKETIERELVRPCLHFCCPWGLPGSSYKTDRDPDLARRAGYCSFSTTVRGAMRAGDSPFFLRRDHMLANWSNRQLRYFLLA